ncbi:hypothetical protein F4805DRAFT_405278 [Annulohypoxylon moriforme]|nr:hypothetical protein F4805DRAFT_405278 [Annulohypoxylon moriforme]
MHYTPSNPVSEEVDSDERKDTLPNDVDTIMRSLISYVQSRLADLEIQDENIGKDQNPRLTESETTAKSVVTINEEVSDEKHHIYENIEDYDNSSDDDIFDSEEITFGAAAKGAHGKGTRGGITPRENHKKPGIKKALACPFLQHNPEKYQEDRHCACASWETTSRVKEHVFRRHVPCRHRCVRCREVFKSAAELHDHQRAHDPCEMRAEDPEDISEVQIEELRSKKKSPGQGAVTEETKWKRMYAILFPEDDVAAISPYYAIRQAQRGNLVDVFDKHLRIELTNMPLNNYPDKNTQDNIRAQARSALQKALEELETNSHKPTRPMSPHPEAQNIDEMDLQNLGGVYNPGIPQMYDTFGIAIDPNIQYGTPYLNGPIDMTFGNWQPPLENMGK